MKLEEYFQLSINDRIAREKARSIMAPAQSPTIPKDKHSLEDYYSIGDTCCQLTRLRSYQLSDILGKYKLF